MLEDEPMPKAVHHRRMHGGSGPGTKTDLARCRATGIHGGRSEPAASTVGIWVKQGGLTRGLRWRERRDQRVGHITSQGTG
jgi:hypothetical protein